MSKPTVSRKFSPAVWAITVAVLAIAGIAAGTSHLRTHASAARVTATSRAAMSAEQSGRVRANLQALPLAFEPNAGQTDPQVKYMARGNGYTVFLTPNESVFAVSSSTGSSAVTGKNSPMAQVRAPEKTKTAAIHMKLVNGNPQAEMAAGSELPGVSNYFIGNDPKKWQSGVKHYASVAYRDVYPGVNMAFHGQQRQVEFDFVVAPQASVAPIRLGVSGAQQVKTDPDGNLVLASAAGNIVMHRPVAYQQINDNKQMVNARFALRADNTIGFELGQYDRGRELVIDPSVSYATYLGGTAEDDAYGIAVDSNGEAYVTGQTLSSNFPTVTGSYSTTFAGAGDAFVTKLKADGSGLIFSTYIGGTQGDSGNGIALDGSGNAYIAGGTLSSDFPTTSGVFQTSKATGLDAFVLELSSSGGTLVFSTYLGGNGDDVATGIAVDSTGAYAVGSTKSTNFPTTAGTIQGTINGTYNGFVTKLNTSGNALVYSTYLGGGTGDIATAVAIDGSNQAYVVGSASNATFPTKNPLQSFGGGVADAFVSVINAAGSGFVYSTFLGGSADDEAFAVAVDSSGDAYVGGYTLSNTSFPLKSALQGTFGGGTQDAFVAEINSSGSALVYSTFLGGELSETVTGIAVDSNKNTYVTGGTSSTKFPITSGAPQTTIGGGNDAFVTEISASGSSLAFSTYLGGELNENTNAANSGAFLGSIAVDAAGSNIYVAGNTGSTKFPTVSPLQTSSGGGTDAFVAKYSTGVSSSFTVSNGALSNASGSPGVSATATITVTSVNAFSSAVTLTCSVSPVVTNGPTCSFTGTNPVTPPANGTATATLNVATTAASSARFSHGERSNRMFLAMILPVFGISLVGAGVKSGANRKRWFGVLLLGLVLMALLLMPACGGSNGNGGGGGGGGGGTPAGAYTITVTGASGSTTVTGSPALTLTVN